MNYNFSDSARKALTKANSEATRLRHHQLGTGHLLLGILSDDNIVATLKELGITHNHIRNTLESSLPEGEPIGTSPHHFAWDATQALQNANNEARIRGDTHVDSVHLLIAILKMESSDGAEVLQQCGLQLDEHTLELLWAPQLTARLHDLIEALDDSRWDVRMAAVSALGNTHDERAVSPLVDALARGEAFAADRIPLHLTLSPLMYAGDAGMHFNPNLIERNRAFEKRDEQLDVAFRTFVKAFTTLGPRVVKPLAELLERKELYHPTIYSPGRIVFEVLAQIGDAKAVKSVVAVLKEGPVGESAALRTLGRIRDARAIPPILAWLEDNNSLLVFEAALALGEIGSSEAVPALIKLLDHQDVMTQRAAIEALGMIKDSRGVSPLLVALRSPAPAIRNEAMKALLVIGDSRAKEALLAAAHEAIRDSNAVLRETAVHVLERFHDARSLVPLIGALQDEVLYRSTAR